VRSWQDGSQDRLAYRGPVRAAPPVPCLVGPTGSGKTDVGVALARDVGAEVVCCDALTVYRDVSILTAKPRPPRDVPHHLLDVVSPAESYSAARFVADADRLVAEIRARGRVPLVVGGTALYLKAWSKGIAPGAGRDPAVRDRLQVLAREGGSAALHDLLRRLDPARAAAIHENDERRLVRALEIVETTGRPASELRREWDAPDRVPTAIVGLARSPEDLAARIDRRVSAMARAGLVDEVRRLLAGPVPVSKEFAQALGFADVRAHLAGRLGLKDCLERIARATRRFSKKQATFFRRFDVAWLDVPGDEPPETTAVRVRDAFTRAGALPPNPAVR
jgi:tRNA dimethylallyltransferase